MSFLRKNQSSEVHDHNDEAHEFKEQTHWMRFDNESFQTEDNLATNLFGTSGYGYRKIHYTSEVQQNKTLFGLGKDKVFFDPEWDVRQEKNLNDLILDEDEQSKDHVVLRRLGHLYPTNKQLRPSFFPKDNYNQPFKHIHDAQKAPHFLHQMSMLSVNQFKSLFFTQDFQDSGLYHAVVNYNGRWQTDVVDDFIPVYEKTGRPIWNMDLEQPWQLIVLKFWAKRLFVQSRDAKRNIMHEGGYHGVLNAPSFAFINAFTNSNWKFFNLSIDGDNFLRKYVNKVHQGHFILKSKNASFVRDAGLIPNEASYQLINLVQIDETGSVSQSQVGKSKTSRSHSKSHRKDANKYIATIRTSYKHHWTGKKSIIDGQFKSVYKSTVQQSRLNAKQSSQSRVVADKKQQDKFSIDRTFSIDGKDLLSLFSSCYISSRRQGMDYYSNFNKIAVPPNTKNAIFLEFTIKNQGFFDFSVKQENSNKIQAGKKSRVQYQEYQEEHGGKKSDSNQVTERYLKVKYILVKDNANSQRNELQRRNEQIFEPLKYETYQIEYLHGYNSGDAHFLHMVPGRYILRIKPQNVPLQSHYVVNYCCSEDIDMQFVRLNEKQRARLMRDAMSSTIDRVRRVNLTKGNEKETVAYGNLFEHVGYGYVGAKIMKESNSRILIDVDPVELKKQGYVLKNKYKEETEPFSVIVKPGQQSTVVLKKLNEHEHTKWPPKGIAIFRK